MDSKDTITVLFLVINFQNMVVGNIHYTNSIFDSMDIKTILNRILSYS